METMRVQVEGGHLRLGDVATLGVETRIELAPHAQPCRRTGRADQVDNDGQAHERLTPPVAADVGEQPVLNLVPLARPRWEVGDGDGQSRAIGQLLQFPLPQAHPRTVAAAGVRRNEQRAGAGVARAPHLLPPSPDRAYREARRIVVNAYADPPRVARQVVDAIRNGLALRPHDETVHPDGHRLSLRAPLLASVLEVA